MQTVHPLADNKHLTIRIEPRLYDISYGDLEGLTVDQPVRLIPT